MNNTNRKSPRHGTRNLSFDRSVEKLAIPTIKQLRDLSLKKICGRIIQGMEIREVLPSICSSSPLLDPSKPMASLLIPSSKKHLSFILLKKWWPSRCHGADTQVLIPSLWYPWILDTRIPKWASFLPCALQLLSSVTNPVMFCISMCAQSSACSVPYKLISVNEGLNKNDILLWNNNTIYG